MGGTRFVGKRLVKLFSERGFSITISSRRVIENFQGLTQLTGERDETIKMLRGLKFDVVIDFTRPEASLSFIDLCAKNNVAYVLGTTGFSDQEKKLITDIAKKIPICFASNIYIAWQFTFDTFIKF